MSRKRRGVAGAANQELELPPSSPRPPSLTLQPSQRKTTPVGGTRQLGLLTIQYLSERLPIRSNARYPMEVRRLFMRHILPQLGTTRDIQTINREVLKELLTGFQETPALQKNIYSALSGLYSWLLYEDLVEFNPLERVRTPKGVPSRSKTLSDQELSSLGKALRKGSYPFAPYVLMLLLTAQRRSEVSDMRWDELTQGNLWTIPAQRTKNNQEHLLLLGPCAQRVLETLPRSGPYVFPSTDVETPISGFSKRIIRLKKDIPIDLVDWRLHDLRRTSASLMALGGVLPHIIEKVLNHSPSKLEGTYQRYAYLREKGEALQVLERQVVARL